MSIDPLNFAQRRFAYERPSQKPLHVERIRHSRGQPMLQGFGEREHEPPAVETSKLKVVETASTPQPIL